MECEGEYYLGKKQGIWSYKYLEQGVIHKLGYNNDILSNETFEDLRNQQEFNGIFEKVDVEKNIREEIKVKGGVRNGNTKTFDLSTGALIRKKEIQKWYSRGLVLVS
jgi:antitoxin component YwqK of YwqJK toxin-antitoxin module